MDPRLKITDSSKTLQVDVPPKTPLVTAAWHALRVQQRQLANQRARAARDTEQTQIALVEIADQIHRLKRVAETNEPATKQVDTGDPEDRLLNVLLNAIANLDQALVRAEIEIVAPEGRPYDDSLMQLLENIAQIPTSGITEPHVAEVVVPAIVWRGTLVRMGKAVIAVENTASEEDG